MVRPLAAFASLAMALAFGGCASSPGEPAQEAPSWRAAHGRDHPLAGRIRDVRGLRWIEPEALFDALASTDLVLLGERHDHPDHHLLQARVIEALVARGRQPAVAFEMLAIDQQAAVAEALRIPGDTRARGEALRVAAGWDESGWPAWPLYAPVFEAALEAGLPIVPANISRSEQRSLGREGAAALPPARRAELGLDEAGDPEERHALAEQIREAHCGHAPDAALDRMVDVQRAWNAQLALALAPTATQETPFGVVRGGVLIAGNEHVRRDRGAPRWLARLAPTLRVATVGLVEVDPADAAQQPDDGAPFDFLWYTPRLDLDDPCEKYRDALERLRERADP